MAFIVFDSFPSFSFSSSLPDVEVNTDYPEIVFHLSCKGRVIFQSSAEVCEDVAFIYDVRSVIEEYMVSISTEYAEFSMYAEDIEGNDSTGVEVFRVLYCHQRVLHTVDCGEFCKKNFLTTLRTFTVSRNSSVFISYFAEKQEDITRHLQIVYSVDGAMPATRTINMNTSVSDGNTVHANVINHSDLLGFLQNEGSITASDMVRTKVLACTFTIGLRSMSIYFIDKEPDIIIRFRNAFNAIEHCMLNALITEKTEKEHSEAISNGVLSLYDDKQETKFEVTAGGLSPSYAQWMKQMLLSRNVYKMEGNVQRRVLITDIDSEISNDNSKLQEVKFTYLYNNDVPYLELSSLMADDGEIFTEPYTVPFV